MSESQEKAKAVETKTEEVEVGQPTPPVQVEESKEVTV